jgi:oligopeptide/dipeptide ABC transporter ATP-binding protein
MSALLSVKDLSVGFGPRPRTNEVVRSVGFELEAGKTLAIVGESGSGKSVTALSINRLVDFGGGVITSGSIVLQRRNGRSLDITRASEADLLDIRGRDVSMIFQEPMTSLNPVHTIGAQIEEAFRLNRDMTGRAATLAATEALERVRIPDAAQRLSYYPHQLSGGMRQRVMIAMALAGNPRLLIADEPTTALDVTVQAQILELIDRIKREFDIGVILITHDLGVIADVAQTVMVMYAGRSMELGTRDAVFGDPLHPYSWGLLESRPRVDQKGERLVPIEGSPPSLIRVPPGCPFHPRCPHRFSPCDKEVPAFKDRGGGHPEACHLAVEDKRRLWAERESRRLKVAV